jgi:hypothetical protein
MDALKIQHELIDHWQRSVTSAQHITALHKFESNKRFVAEFTVTAAKTFTKCRQLLRKPRTALGACLHCYARVGR